MTDADELRSWGEIATFLKVSVVTAWRLERDDGLPVVRLCGRQVRASKIEICRWKEENSTKKPSVK